MGSDFLQIDHLAIRHLEHLASYNKDLHDYIVSQPGNRNPLHVAVVKNNAEIVNALKNFNVSFDFKHMGGATPLWNAAKKGSLSVVSSLVDAGASVDLAHDDGTTPLYIAVTKGHKEVVEYLIDHGANLDSDNSNGGGYTALQAAITKNRVDVARILIAKGANIFHNNNEAFSLLEPAVGNGYLEMVRLLLDSGITILPNIHHKPLVYLALSMGHFDVADLLLERDKDLKFIDDSYGLFESVYRGELEKVSNFLKENNHIDYFNPKNWTLMHLACFKGHTDIVDLLIKHHALIDSLNADGDTPLVLAARCGHSYIVSLLIDAGADVNAGKIPAIWAAVENNHDDVVALLVRGGANIEIVNQDGRTPFEFAIDNGYTGVVGAFLNAHPNDISEYRNILPSLDAAKDASIIEEFVKHCLASDVTRECLGILNGYEDFPPIVNNLLDVMGYNEL
jgi:ankyrin repeat protein